jgi:hypothetical protein
MRIAVYCRALPLLLAALSGCRSRSDLVEAELRTKDRQLREAQAEVERTRMVNEAFERDFMQRQQGQPPGPALASPKDIVLSSGTGGVDRDGLPGDEAIEVVVTPRDEDGQPARAVGVLCVTAWEILPGGVKVPLSTWEINSTDLRRSWKAGLFGSGYHVVLPWKKIPTQQRLRVAAQLQLPDGRVYEADKDITIRLLPGAAAPAPETIMPIGPTPPSPEKILPINPVGPPLP